MKKFEPWLRNYFDQQHLGGKIERKRTRRGGGGIGISGLDAAGVIGCIYREGMRLGKCHRDRYLLRVEILARDLSSLGSLVSDPINAYVVPDRQIKSSSRFLHNSVVHGSGSAGKLDFKRFLIELAAARLTEKENEIFQRRISRLRFPIVSQQAIITFSRVGGRLLRLVQQLIGEGPHHSATKSTQERDRQIDSRSALGHPLLFPVAQ